MSVTELANSAEITSVAEDGDYKAFLVRINASSKDVSSAFDREGKQNAVVKLVGIIDKRIANKDFDDIFDGVDDMLADYGVAPKVRNLNAERVVICNDSTGYVFKWNSDD